MIVEMKVKWSIQLFAENVMVNTKVGLMAFRIFTHSTFTTNLTANVSTGDIQENVNPLYFMIMVNFMANINYGIVMARFIIVHSMFITNFTAKLTVGIVMANFIIVHFISTTNVMANLRYGMMMARFITIDFTLMEQKFSRPNNDKFAGVLGLFYGRPHNGPAPAKENLNSRPLNLIIMTTITINKREYLSTIEIGHYNDSCKKCGSSWVIIRATDKDGTKDVYCRRCVASIKYGKKIINHYDAFADLSLRELPYQHPRNTSDRTILDAMSSLQTSKFSIKPRRK